MTKKIAVYVQGPATSAPELGSSEQLSCPALEDIFWPSSPCKPEARLHLCTWKQFVV